MAILYVNNIKKSYGVDVVLDGINLIINEGDKIGFVGRNGAGKTTLFKIITGSIKQDEGEIILQKGKTLGYLSQNLDIDENLTAFEEVMKVFSDIKEIEERMRQIEEELSDPNSDHERLLKEYGRLQVEFENRNGYSCESYAKGVLIGLGLLEEEISKKICYLSGGQKTRVALAKLLLKSPDVLLLDEPTNHLDLGGIAFLENFLKEYRGTVLIISHDRYFLDVITNKTVEVLNGKVEEYGGNYSYFIKERKNRIEQRVKEYELKQKEIKRLEEMIERFRSFNREKSIKQAESKEKMLLKLEENLGDRPITYEENVRISFDTRIKSGNDVLQIEELSKSYGEKVLFNNINLMIRKAEKVALIGENGRGKSTLLKIIKGEVQPDSGYIRLGRNVEIGYYDQEQRDLNPEKTILDEVWDEFPQKTVREIRNALAAFLFKGDDVFKKIKDLSGGEKCRLNLLKLMLKKANFLLLDEPTNHLDILTREELEDTLLEYDGTIFVISHDRYFLNKVVQKICELEENSIVEYLGNYDYYMAKKNAKEDEIVVNEEGKTKTQIEKEKKKLKQERDKIKNIKNEIKKVEAEIEKKEKNIAELEEELCKEEVYTNPNMTRDINQQIINLKDELEKCYEIWEELLANIEE
ncbi:ABC-F family ATP-binding cassette domain-containing protein [Caloramator proteoclasticus]|uniref:ATP-binding cassette, subfamily F, member 3 n=1 Tax=Caloramator proteoclasticus DSM 10124 TaxID=1121262 RepID=A0A1M5A5L7_9CLOT|nr:ABC-F family ATP-binding cassette domain-containing protein [Caloramator proteoclasticus]SHF25326.1 ATP-binding cassette, subfamily F, member 3 [Caloramator proteoclasticus DSM 10124]